jgi:hypothetical protein
MHFEILISRANSGMLSGFFHSSAPMVLQAGCSVTAGVTVPCPFTYPSSRLYFFATDEDLEVPKV